LRLLLLLQSWNGKLRRLYFYFAGNFGFNFAIRAIFGFAWTKVLKILDSASVVSYFPSQCHLEVVSRQNVSGDK